MAEEKKGAGAKMSEILNGWKNVEKETVSGIIKSDLMLREEADKRDGHAKVVAVSQDVKNVKVGDTIIPKGQGFMVMVEDVEYFQMNMFDVLGIVKA